MIFRAVPRSNRRQAATAEPHPVGSPVATGGGRVLTTMSEPRAQRCVYELVPGSSLHRCLSRPGAIDPQNVRAADGSGSKGLGGWRRAPRSCAVNPHMIPVRGAPVPQPRAVQTPASSAAISGASAVFRGFRPASLPTATTRDRGRLRLIATIRQDVLGVSGDLDVGQEPTRATVTPCHARVGPTTPQQFGAKHQTCPHWAVPGTPDSTLEMGAAEMGTAIRCPVFGDSTRGTETAEPLTSNPEPWSPPSSGF
jgi:hypothetical protein